MRPSVRYSAGSPQTVPVIAPLLVQIVSFSPSIRSNTMELLELASDISRAWHPLAEMRPLLVAAVRKAACRSVSRMELLLVSQRWLAQRTNSAVSELLLECASRVFPTNPAR